jgi:peroxiredoxin
LIVFVDPDLNGYLVEIVSALDSASEAEPARFQRWALVVPDDVVSQARQYRGVGKLRVFPESRRRDALAGVAA